MTRKELAEVSERRMDVRDETRLRELVYRVLQETYEEYLKAGYSADRAQELAKDEVSEVVLEGWRRAL